MQNAFNQPFRLSLSEYKSVAHRTMHNHHNASHNHRRDHRDQPGRRPHERQRGRNAHCIGTPQPGGRRCAAAAAFTNTLLQSASGTTDAIADAVFQSVTEAAEKKVTEVTATLATEAKNHLNLAISICCGAICCSLFGVLVLAAHITAFVGLAHTQRVDLDPLCPAHYWNGQLALLILRWCAFILAGCTMCLYRSTAACAALITCCTLTTILTFAIADTAVTAQAWAALNCTEAIRVASRSADPLLTASGSLFVLIDWLLLLCACAASVRACRTTAEVMADD
jgi:hypothetical protein